MGNFFKSKQIEYDDYDKVVSNFVEKREVGENRMTTFGKLKRLVKQHCDNMIVLNLFAVMFFFAMSINLYLIYSDYRVEYHQKQSLFEAQKYIRSYRKAYVMGQETFTVKGREYVVKNSMMFIGKQYLGADDKTKCNFQVIPRIVDGELKFRVPKIDPACVEHISKEKDFNKIRKILRVI